MDSRSTRSELKEKAEVGKMEFWKKPRIWNPPLTFDSRESRRVWQRVTCKPRKIFRSTWDRTRKPRKSQQAKIESFILYPAFLVPRNAKQRRGNCHNLFLPSGFFRVSARKTRQPGPSRVDLTKVHHAQRPSRSSPEHISRSLRRFDQVWPRY